MKLFFLAISSIAFHYCFTMDQEVKNESLGYLTAFSKSAELRAKAEVIVRRFDATKELMVQSQHIKSIERSIEPIKIALITDRKNLNLREYSCPEIAELKALNISFDQLLENCELDEADKSEISSALDNVVLQLDCVQLIQQAFEI